MRSLLILTFFACGIIAKAQEMEIYKKAMLERLENSKTYTLKVANLMPEADFGFKPVATEMDFGTQCLHMAQNLEMIVTRYLGAELPYPPATPNIDKKEEVIDRVSRAYDFAIETVRQMKDADFGEEVAFFAGPKTKLQMVNLMNDHQAHHRGQIIVYLRLKGIAPPGYIGW
jgi:uncharacterized damage-inducible protein DinB